MNCTTQKEKCQKSDLAWSSLHFIPIRIIIENMKKKILGSWKSFYAF